jgi:hypothetical protein
MVGEAEKIYMTEELGALLEIWRQERVREDKMLAFSDGIDYPITNKALAEKFDLKPTRVGLLLHRRREARKLERMRAEIQQLRESNDFTAMAEKLWMELGWIADKLEQRRGIR